MPRPIQTDMLRRLFRRLCLLGALLVCLPLLSGLPPLGADEPVVRDEAVLARQATMRQAKATLGVLMDMIAQRRRFDRPTARAAQADLVDVLDTLPERFSEPHMDRHSRARSLIWQDWGQFSALAQAAARAARDLRPNTLPALRRSLPDLMATCLACHRHYRRER